MKKLILALVLLLIPIKAGDIHTRKITGTAATVALSSTSVSVRWVSLSAPAANGADALYGDATASSSVGTPLVKATSFTFPPTAQGGYDLAQISVYIAMSDVVYVTWDTF